MPDDIKLAHAIYRQEEITKALVDQLLQRQGLDPAQHETASRAVYRIIDGSLIASIAIDRVTPHSELGKLP